MSAAIHRLPNAQSEPVSNQRRRGCAPTPVIILSRVKMKRTAANQLLSLRSALARATAAEEECFQRCLRSDEAMKAAKKLDAELTVELKLLERQRKALEEEIAALAQRPA